MGNGQRTSKLQRFWHLSLADKWLFVRAVYWLGVARLWLSKTSFPELAARLSADAGTEEADPNVLRRISYAVSAAGGNVPWRSDCFPQAIAAHQLHKKYGCASTIHLGVDRARDDELLALAWLSCGEIIVTGGSEVNRYAEIHRLGE